MLAAWVATEFALAVAGNDGTSGRRAFDPPFTLSGIGPQLLLLQAVGSDQGETWNWVAWSISVEFWTYLLFAVGSFFPTEARACTAAGNSHDDRLHGARAASSLDQMDKSCKMCVRVWCRLACV